VVGSGEEAAAVVVVLVVVAGVVAVVAGVVCVVVVGDVVVAAVEVVEVPVVVGGSHGTDWVSGAGPEPCPPAASAGAASASAATTVAVSGDAILIVARHCRCMRTRLAAVLENLRGSDTSKAAGLAGAMIANNVIALISSVVFARLVSDYGALAALISYLLILSVFGQALQVATAREGVLGHLGVGEDLLHTLERWARAMAVFTVVVTVISILLRVPIAQLVGVRHNRGGTWAAAAGIPAGCAYLQVSILRGALQGVGDYKSVGISLIGEQTTRLISGAILAAIGLGVAGAYLGSLISYVAMSGYCALRLYGRLAGPEHRRWGAGDAGRAALGLWRHVRLAAIPILGLAVIQLLQNVDLIVAKHQLDNRNDNSYAVAAVAAKVVIWVAMGAGFYLVPETSRRRAAGEDTRPVLLQSLAIIGVCAVPCLLIFAFGAHPLLAAVFGKKRAIASNSLLPLGAAFTVLAATYLAVQYMLALRRTAFLGAIALVAVIEPILLLHSSRKPASFAVMVLLVQAIGAVLAYAVALRRLPPPDPGSPPERESVIEITPEPIA
jgi:O-antigen/teichoic acid export membrane protein